MITAFGLAAAAAYLVARLAGSMHGVPAWLSIPTYLVEVAGCFGSFVLAWALWPVVDRRRDAVSAHRTIRAPSRVDAVVRVCDQPDHEVRATLLALRSVRSLDDIVVVDIGARPSIAALATEFQSVYAATDPDDLNGLHVMAAAVRTPTFLLLDAGDIPSIDIVEVLVPDLIDPRIAVVQGLGVSLHDDSPEHGPGHRHDLTFERSSLNPALGRRESAMWLGSGSLVRTDALRRVRRSNDRPLTAHWTAGAEILAAGWHITAPAAAPVVAHRALTSDRSAYEDRVERARAARRLLIGRRGVLRARSFTPAHRMAILAWTVRPLSGLRRVLFLAVLCAALVMGEVPFHATAWMLGLWVAAFLYTSLGIGLLSGWALQPGDRTRWSLHTLGPACSSLRPTVVDRPVRQRFVSHPVAQYGAGLLMSVVALSVVIVLRGVSERLTHTLGSMPRNELLALLAIALWVLGLSLELLRVLAGRGTARRSPRVAASVPAVVADRAVSIIDITPVGAGVLGRTGLEVGSHVLLESSLTTAAGCTEMRVPVVVRNSRLMHNGDYRIGVEFVATNNAVANALAEFCIVETMWERMGIMPGRSVLEARSTVYVDDEPTPHTGRTVARVMSLFALVGAVASAMPADVEASPSLQHTLAGQVVSTSIGVDRGVAGAVVTAVCSNSAGPDARWGTSDDVYESPVSIVSDVNGGYRVALHGVACWSQVAPPAGYASPNAGVGSSSRLQPIDVSNVVSAQRTMLGSLSPVAADGGGSIGDLVWTDLNRDGVHDVGEPGLSGVQLTLFDPSNRVLGRTLSGPKGDYAFDHLAPGSYRVSASNLPSAMAITNPIRGSNSMLDSDVDAVTGQSMLVTIGAGERRATVDVGVIEAQAPSGLGSRVDVQVLPPPATDELALAQHRRSMLALLVMGVAALLAGSVLLGLAWPQRRLIFQRTH
jgi:hypothetical protein